MKKILLFSVFLSLPFFVMSNVAFASTNTNQLEQAQRFERLLEKIQEGDLLSPKMKQECENVFEEQMNSPRLTTVQKKIINECIEALYSKKFEVMEQKIEALRSIIVKLKRFGKNTDVLERNLKQAEGRLKLLKESF